MHKYILIKCPKITQQNTTFLITHRPSSNRKQRINDGQPSRITRLPYGVAVAYRIRERSGIHM